MSVVPENHKTWETPVNFHQTRQNLQYTQPIPSISNVTAVRIEEIALISDDNIPPGIYGLRFISSNNSFEPLFEGCYDRRTFAFLAEPVTTDLLKWKPANESAGLLRREQNDVKRIDSITFQLIRIDSPSTIATPDNIQVMMRLTFLTAGHPINNRGSHLH